METIKKWIWLGALAAAFYGHSQWAFSDARLRSWLDKHEHAIVAQQDRLCDAYAWDVTVNIRAHHPRGEWQVDGGKEQVCSYLKHSNSFVRLLKPEFEGHTDIVSKEALGFPWMKTKASVQQTRYFRMGSRTLTETAEIDYVFRRTVKGVRIVEMTVRSDGQFPR